VECAVAAEEARVGEDDAAPGLAHQRGSDEVRRLVGPDAEEDLLDELLYQLGQRRRATVAHGCSAAMLLAVRALLASGCDAI
jgi:hypothetical protein